MTDGPGFSEVVGRASVYGGRVRRSELHRWMRQHFDRLAKRRKAGGLSWANMAKAAAEAGIRDAEGKAPSTETMRKTWARVRDEKRLGRSPKPEPRVVERVKWVEPAPVQEPVRPAAGRPAAPAQRDTIPETCPEGGSAPASSRGAQKLSELRAELLGRSLPMPDPGK